MFGWGIGDATRDSRKDHASVMKFLRERNVAKVEVPFSGSNDEGGADGIYLYDARGQRIGEVNYDSTVMFALTPKLGKARMKKVIPGWAANFENPRRYEQTVYIPGEVITGEHHEKIRDVLEGPAEESYGGWGGDRIAGVFTWDVKSGRCSEKITERSFTEYYE